MENNAGWSKKYYYISDYLKERIIGAKIVNITGGFENNFRGKIYLDNGLILSWFEDSEGCGIGADWENGKEDWN